VQKSRVSTNLLDPIISVTYRASYVIGYGRNSSRKTAHRLCPRQHLGVIARFVQNRTLVPAVQPDDCIGWDSCPLPRGIGATGLRPIAVIDCRRASDRSRTQTGYDRLGLFNYLVGAGEDQRRDSEAERPGEPSVLTITSCSMVKQKISCGRPL
jgi:hypothetical protein